MHLPSPSSGVRLGSDRAGLHALLAILSALGLVALAGCASGGGPADTPGTEEPDRAPAEAGPREDEAAATGPTTVFLYDRSTSVSDGLLAQSRELTRRRLAELAAGGRVAVRGVGGEDDEDGESWILPAGWPERGAEELLPDVRERVVGLTGTSRGQRSGRSDLLEALEDLAEEMEGLDRRGSVVYLFSDMLQVGGDLDFEAADVEAARRWLREREAEGELPDLRGVCVVVVGAHEDTVRQRAVRSFWEDYFRAAGAVLLPENYTARMVRLPADPCPTAGPAR